MACPPARLSPSSIIGQHQTAAEEQHYRYSSAADIFVCAWRHICLQAIVRYSDRYSRHYRDIPDSRFVYNHRVICLQSAGVWLTNSFSQIHNPHSGHFFCFSPRSMRSSASACDARYPRLDVLCRGHGVLGIRHLLVNISAASGASCRWAFFYAATV